MSETIPAAPSDAANALLRKPSAWGYAFAAGLLAFGVAVFLAVLLPARAEVHHAVSGLQRVVLPEGGGFTSEGPGTVTLYYEKRGLLKGVPHESPLIWRAETLRLSTMDGQTLELVPTEGAVIYAVDPFFGESIYQVELPSAGFYRLSLGAEEAADLTPPRVIAVGHVPVELLKSGLFGVYGGAVVLGLAFVVSTLWAIITWSRRRDAAIAACGSG